MDFQSIGTGIWVNPNTIAGTDLFIGHGSCIGYGSINDNPAKIGERVHIGAFCVICTGSEIDDEVEIDHYCRISSGVTIGKKSKILYGVQIFSNSVVGKNCIIGGDLAERTILEDNVTFMGEIAHSHRNPNLDWDTTDEPSPVIKYGSVVGVDSLIVGGVTIGPQSYIGAGEVVRSDIPPRTVLYKGKLSSIESWRGIIKIRE